MKYISTRSGSKEICTSFEEALCSGYAPDEGLYVPESIPQVSAATFKDEWSKLSFPQLSKALLRLYISPDEIPDADLEQICVNAFCGFDNPDHAVPVVPFVDNKSTTSSQPPSFFISELFHGPTFCFKDLGMRVVIGLLSYFCTLRNRKITLLVSTTGDTGPAAVQAVADINNPLLKILVHYPHEQISDFQRKQLTTTTSRSSSVVVRVAAFEGGGDDMDRPIKVMLSSQQRNNNKLWTGVNSYNIGRPLMQAVHYVWTYLRVAEAYNDFDIGVDPIDIILPTGAMGNIAGGYMAKQMGLPIHKFVAAVNSNDIVHRCITKGQFYKEPLHRTLSEAINIQVPYNMERLLYYLTNQNSDLISDWMKQVDTTQRLDLPPEWLTKMQSEFASARCTDEELCDTLRVVRTRCDYWADPHTGVALTAARKLGYLPGMKMMMMMGDGDSAKNDQTFPPTALLSTASPCKFQEAIVTALGEEGWKEYAASKDYPHAARHYLELAEVPPTIYHWPEGKTLEETQAVWQAQARQIVAELEGH